RTAPRAHPALHRVPDRGAPGDDRLGALPPAARAVPDRVRHGGRRRSRAPGAARRGPARDLVRRARRARARAPPAGGPAAGVTASGARFGRVSAQIAPPGAPTSETMTPNTIESASASAVSSPTRPKAVIMAPSRTPQPAMLIGTMETSMTGGTRIRQSNQPTSRPSASAISHTEDDTATWMPSEISTIEIGRATSELQSRENL